MNDNISLHKTMFPEKYSRIEPGSDILSNFLGDFTMQFHASATVENHILSEQNLLDALFKKALYIPGNCVMAKDAGATEYERDLIACDTLAHIWSPFGTVTLFSERVLSASEASVRLGRESVDELFSRVKKAAADAFGEEKVVLEYMEMILDEVTQEMDLFSKKSISLGDIRLISAATAAGALGNEYAVGLEHRNELASLWAETLFLATENPSATSLKVSSYTYFMMLAGRAFTGFANISGFVEKLRRTGVEDGTFDEGYANAVVKAAEYVRRLAESVFAWAKKNVPEQTKTPGAAWAFLLSGRRPNNAEYWLPKELFTPAFPADISFMPCGRGRWGTLVESAAKDAYNNGLLSHHPMEKLMLMSESVSGRMLSTSAEKTRSAWTRFPRSIPGDIRVCSPFETPGFTERLDELAATSEFGKAIKRRFVLDCLDVFSLSESGGDNHRLEEDPENLGNDVLSEKVREWLASSALDVVKTGSARELEHLEIPCIPEILFAKSGDGFLLDDMVSKATPSFRRALSAAFMMSGRRFRDACRTEERRNPGGLESRVRETLVALASALCGAKESNREMYDVAERVFDKAVKNAEEALGAEAGISGLFGGAEKNI